MVAIKDADFSNVDAVFCCLPHGTTQVCLNLITLPMHISEFVKTSEVEDVISLNENV